MIGLLDEVANLMANGGGYCPVRIAEARALISSVRRRGTLPDHQLRLAEEELERLTIGDLTEGHS
ncbi:MAG: hypothetical protein NVSMB1_21660 [Polyangiales bacterium]